MPDELTVLVAIALWALAITAAFVLIALICAIRRWRGLPVGDRLIGSLALSGGLAIGTYLLIGPDLIVDVPFVAASLILVVGQWRRGERTRAGLVLAGSALPWTVLWAFYLLALAFGGADFEPIPTASVFLLGAVPAAIGIAIALRGNPAAAGGEVGAGDGR